MREGRVEAGIMKLKSEGMVTSSTYNFLESGTRSLARSLARHIGRGRSGGGGGRFETNPRLPRVRMHPVGRWDGEGRRERRPPESRWRRTSATRKWQLNPRIQMRPRNALCQEKLGKVREQACRRSRGRDRARERMRKRGRG